MRVSDLLRFSQDFSGVNLEVARFSGAGIIGFSLIDPELTYNLTQVYAEH